MSKVSSYLLCWKMNCVVVVQEAVIGIQCHTWIVACRFIIYLLFVQSIYVFNACVVRTNVNE